MLLVVAACTIVVDDSAPLVAADGLERIDAAGWGDHPGIVCQTVDSTVLRRADVALDDGTVARGEDVPTNDGLSEVIVSSDGLLSIPGDGVQILDGPAWVRTGTNGLGILTDGGEFVVPDMEGRQFLRFASLADVMAGTSSASVTMDFWATQYTVEDGVVYGAWFATNEIQVATLDEGLVSHTLTLERGAEDWVRSLDVVDDVLLLNAEGQIEAFDLDSGALLATWVFPSGLRLDGLYCSA